MNISIIIIGLAFLSLFAAASTALLIFFLLKKKTTKNSLNQNPTDHTNN